MVTLCRDVIGNVFFDMIRRVTDVPVAVGFGISTGREAGQVAEIADGVIVGSAIVRLVEGYQHDPGVIERVGRFVLSLKTAMSSMQPAHGPR